MVDRILTGTVIWRNINGDGDVTVIMCREMMMNDDS